MNEEELWRYHFEKKRMYHNVCEMLRSMGREGLSELLRIALIILNYPHQRSDGRSDFDGHKGITKLFTSVFPESCNGDRDVYKEPILFYPETLRYITGELNLCNFTEVGSSFWHKCILTTPSKTVRFDGPWLFWDYWQSAAFGLFNINNLKEGQDLLRKVAIANENQEFDVISAWLNLAATYEVEGNYDEVLKVFDTAIEMYPDAEDLWINLGILCQRQGDIDGAIERCKFAIATRKFACLEALGDAYLHKRDYENAMSTFERLIEINPNRASWGWNRIGYILQLAHDIDKAIKAYETAILVDPGNHYIYEDIALAYEMKGDVNKKAEYLEKSIACDKRSYLFYQLAELLIIDMRDYDRAIARFRREIDVDPENAMCWRTLGMAYSAKADYQKAIEVYGTAISKELLIIGLRDPWNPWSFWELLGDATRMNGNLEGAIQAYKTAVEKEPGNVELWELLEDALLENGDFEEAKTVHQRAEERIPEASNDSEIFFELSNAGENVIQ